MSITYTITRKSQRLNYFPIFIIIAYMAVLYVFMVYRLGSEKVNVIISVCIVLFLIQLIPLILLHQNYFSINKGDELICDFENKSISYNHLNNIISFKTYEIKSIRHFMSYPAKNKKAPLLAWDRYNYCNIELTDGRLITVTSLLVPKIDLLIHSMGIEKNKVAEIADIYSMVANS